MDSVYIWHMKAWLTFEWNRSSRHVYGRDGIITHYLPALGLFGVWRLMERFEAAVVRGLRSAEDLGSACVVVSILLHGRLREIFIPTTTAGVIEVQNPFESRDVGTG